MNKCIFLWLLCCTSVQLAVAQNFTKTQGFQKFNGFFDFYYESETDKMFLSVPELNKEFLYVYSLSSGVGSNDLGLDRGQLGNEQVVHFKKAGNKILLVQPNLQYRAITNNTLEKQSVEQAFAQSVLGGFEIVEQVDDAYLIDVTDFLVRDAHGVAQRLRNADQGSFSLDKKRSAWNFDRIKAFPKNVEFDVLLTFSGDAKGRYIRSVAPDPDAVTVTEHHSFVALPETGFEMRPYDPRCGSFPFSYADYATPVYEPLVKRFVPRHRLQKKNPQASSSEAVEPIVYYLDNGTPEPIRSALLDGARWWNQAFEAIGYKNAFQVKVLPDDADPMDVRYNVIQWVHRSTRGWSYGSSVTDPRTGEIIKGHVSLGSLRIRQDFMIAQALTDKPFAERDDNHEAMMELALARIRQLSAHEIGHTLGFAHNFAASANDRASVMDYPHPQFEVRGNKIDFSQAYDVGIGEWDKVTVAYAYSDFPEGTDQKQALNAILDDARQKGLRYISDQDARPLGGAHATAHLWDNGKSATEELEAILQVRQVAIENFSEDNIREGEPSSVLEDVFVPLYFLHRYQTEAAVKLVGGLDYSYTVKGDGQERVATVPKKEQEEALDALLETLDPNVLAIPEDKLALFPPRSMGYGRSRESFKSETGVAFDALGAAATAADQTIGMLLHPERTNRLIQQTALDSKQLTFGDVLDRLLQKTLEGGKSKSTYYEAIQEIVVWQVFQGMMRLAANKDCRPQATAILYAKLREYQNSLQGKTTDDQASLLAAEIALFFKDPKQYEIKNEVPQIPDGSPIGMACYQESYQ